MESINTTVPDTVEDIDEDEKEGDQETHPEQNSRLNDNPEHRTHLPGTTSGLMRKLTQLVMTNMPLGRYTWQTEWAMWQISFTLYSLPGLRTAFVFFVGALVSHKQHKCLQILDKVGHNQQVGNINFACQPSLQTIPQFHSCIPKFT